MVTLSTSWDINSKYLYEGTLDNYSGSGPIARNLNLNPCQEAYDKYYTALSRSTILKNIIDNDPCILLTMRPMGEGLGYQSEWMEGVHAMTYMLYAAFAIPMMEIALPIFIENLKAYTAKKAIEKTAQYTIGVSVDAFMQAIIHYYFEQEGDERDWALAWSDINWVEANLSGAENLISNPLISHASSCLRSGILEDGKLREGFDMQSCFTGALTSIVADLVFKSLKGAYKKIEKIAKEKPEKLVHVLSTLGKTDADIAKALNDHNLLPFDQEIVSSVRRVETNFNAAAEAVEQGITNDATNSLRAIDGKLAAEPVWFRNDQRFKQRRVELANGKAPETKEWAKQTISTNPLPNQGPLFKFDEVADFAERGEPYLSITIHKQRANTTCLNTKAIRNKVFCLL